MNTDLRKKVKNDFGKTMENVRTHRDIKLATTERRKNYLVSEPSYYKVFHITYLRSRNEKKNKTKKQKKTQVLMNKPLYLGFSILELSKILIFQFWYDYAKKAKLCYMDNFHCLHKNISYLQSMVEDLETRFDTSNYELERLSPKRKNKEVTGLMKGELVRKFMTKFVGFLNR